MICKIAYVVPYFSARKFKCKRLLLKISEKIKKPKLAKFSSDILSMTNQNTTKTSKMELFSKIVSGSYSCKKLYLRYLNRF